MKHINGILIILGFTMLGELLHLLVPFPIPAAIYGLVLLFLALLLGVVPLDYVKTESEMLLSMITLFFIAPAVNLLDYWQSVAENAAALTVILILSTVLVFGISGAVTQHLMKGRDDDV